VGPIAESRPSRSRRSARELSPPTRQPTSAGGGRKAVEGIARYHSTIFPRVRTEVSVTVRTGSDSERGYRGESRRPIAGLKAREQRRTGARASRVGGPGQSGGETQEAGKRRRGTDMVAGFPRACERDYAPKKLRPSNDSLRIDKLQILRGIFEWGRSPKFTLE
jgi:hypothetical protein